jgi:NADPH-dependent 2,4-dienoyl-CoA reductase/sulfur reductase-like enzyme
VKNVSAARTATPPSPGCIHNPAAGEEQTLGIGTLKPATHRKKVVVVGGGPAGMKAAEISARRGHEVTRIEKGDALGGQVLISATVPLRAEFRGIIRYLDTQLKKLPAEIKLNTEATVDSILAMNPEPVVSWRPARCRAHSATRISAPT